MTREALRPSEADSRLGFVEGDDGFDVLRRSDGRLLARQNAHPGSRPYLHPLIAPDGRGVVTEDSPSHHPWQHGLYTGLNDVNGNGFWTEGLHTEPEKDGTFEVREARPSAADGDSADWRVVTDYVAADGTPTLAETQEWRLTDSGSSYALDLTWTLEALVDTEFGQYPYGGPMFRAPWRPGTNWSLITSEGFQLTSGLGHERARWVLMSLPIPGREELRDPLVSILVMDHSANDLHPITWRVSDDLCAIPSRSQSSGWSLARGAAVTDRYRFLVGSGALDVTDAESEWREYVAGASSSSR